MLTDDNIGTQGIKYFCSKVSQLKRLSSLYIYDNVITDEGIECIYQNLNNMPRLEFLDFSSI